jgi:hypothetical protein
MSGKMRGILKEELEIDWFGENEESALENQVMVGVRCQT